MQDNDIINLLGIKDSTIKILSVATKDTEKTVEFEKRIELHCTTAPYADAGCIPKECIAAG